MEYNDPHTRLRQDAQSCLDELRQLHGYKDELKRRLASSTVARESAQRDLRLLQSALSQPQVRSKACRSLEAAYAVVKFVSTWSCSLPLSFGRGCPPLLRNMSHMPLPCLLQLSVPRESESGRPVSFLRKVDIKGNEIDQETLLQELL